ncbi:MAG: response regulator transcription factor [Lachnospiraceae bacterium]|nr:response regulator transcription factor [Lachnospiraceae bacterium]
MYKILVVEDDAVISEQIGKFLEKWGYEVETVKDFADVMAQFVSCEPQLVLLDIGLPFYNGYYWCSEIRKVSQVPIIFISSASDNMNVVMAVNMGGDDFVVKPFDLEILQAKIQALLRRAYAFTAPGTVLEYRGVLLNVTDMSLSYQKIQAESVQKEEGTRIELTKNEFRILQTLFEAAGGVVSRDMLMKRLWDDECFVDDNTLTVNINRLRKRLAEIGLGDLILTKKSVGYLLGEAD